MITLVCYRESTNDDRQFGTDVDPIAVDIASVDFYRLGGWKKDVSSITSLLQDKGRQSSIK